MPMLHHQNTQSRAQDFWNFVVLARRPLLRVALVSLTFLSMAAGVYWLVGGAQLLVLAKMVSIVAGALIALWTLSSLCDILSNSMSELHSLWRYHRERATGRR